MEIPPTPLALDGLVAPTVTPPTPLPLPPELPLPVVIPLTPPADAQFPAAPPAVEQFTALPLPDADCDELPPAPPVEEELAEPELVALLVQALLSEPLSLDEHFAEPSLPASAYEYPPPPLSELRVACSMEPSAPLSLDAPVQESADDLPDVDDSDPPPEPLLAALLLLVVSPPVAVAPVPLAALPLSVALWDELPPAPPVAPLIAPPELELVAVELLLPPPLLLSDDLALPSLYASAYEQASPPLLSFDSSCWTEPCDPLLLSDPVHESAWDSFEVADSDPLPDPLLAALLELVVSPPVAEAVLLLAELPLPDADCEELPAAPPVAELEALPELPAVAVDEPLPSDPLLLSFEDALPSFSAYAAESASPPLLSSYWP